MNRVVIESPLAPVHEWKQVAWEYDDDFFECVRCFVKTNSRRGMPARTVVDCQKAGLAPCSFKRNIRYAQLCLLDCLRRGEAPFASHLLYPQVFDDKNDLEREFGIAAGLEWGAFADVCAVYVDFGVSPGMSRGAARASRVGITVEYRNLPPELLARVGEDPSLWETLVQACRGCGKPLDAENRRVADGCPCNSPRGVNHGLVARETCTCAVCDPEQTGATRYPLETT